MDTSTKVAVDAIVNELDRQAEKGFDAAHDDQHADGSIAECAAFIVEDVLDPEKPLTAYETRLALYRHQGRDPWPADRASPASWKRK